MSSEQEQLFGEFEMSLIADCFIEPSYISEVARKMQELNPPLGYTPDEIRKLETFDRTWTDVTENHAVRMVSFVANALDEDREYEITKDDVGYDVEDDAEYGESQKVGSVTPSMGPDGGLETKDWRSYTLVHNEAGDPSEIGSVLEDAGLHELVPRFKDMIDWDVTKEYKMGVIRLLSRAGNKASINAEKIATDVFRRQFKYYEEKGYSRYNDPGVDFWVADEGKREHGLVLETSVKSVNPIGDPYISSKIEAITDMESSHEFEDIPYDLVVLGPRFSKQSESRYEDPGSPQFHKNPTSDMVHLHRVPNPGDSIYRHFLKEEVKQSGEMDGGNPIIVPDIDRVQERLLDGNQVGRDYPVVDEDFSDFEDALEYVNRDYDIITESRYRNMLREAIEPLLWEFLRPYKIEQFLVDLYWDKGLTQGEIGRLVSRTGGTIGRWMRDGLDADRWDVVRRGTGAPNINDETLEVWKRMYRGQDPFPEPYSAYRIQAEYNRFPFWGLDDWDEWHNEMTKQERIEFMREQDSYRDALSYTVLVGAGENRFQPSYTFILRTLREMDVEIRNPDEAPQAPYAAYSNSKTIEWMINRDTGLVASDTEGRDLVKQEDVEVFDSYLEVGIGTWLSENEVSYAHEPFTLPSIYGPGRDQWERMVTAIRAVGKSATSREEALDMFAQVRQEAIEDDSDVRLDRLLVNNNFNEFVGRVLPVWNEIYGKHNLGDERQSPDPLPGLEFFDKRYVIPDLVVYRGEGSTERDMNWDGWDNWSHILEVSGLWGVTIPPEVEDDKWWRWYRVSGVAFKELAYRLLGLWETDDGDPRVVYLVPEQPEIPGVTDGIPNALRDDDNYVIFNTTQSSLQLEGLKVLLDVTAEDIESGLSPPIELVSYDRPKNGSEMTPIEYQHSGIDISSASEDDRVFVADEDTIVFWGDLGEVFITSDSVHVKESMWLRQNMLMIREYVTDVVSRLNEKGIVTGMTRVV